MEQNSLLKATVEKTVTQSQDNPNVTHVTHHVDIRFPNIECNCNKTLNLGKYDKTKIIHIIHQPLMCFNIGNLKCTVCDVQHSAKLYSQKEEKHFNQKKITASFAMHPGSFVPDVGLGFTYKIAAKKHSSNVIDQESDIDIARNHEQLMIDSLISISPTLDFFIILNGSRETYNNLEKLTGFQLIDCLDSFFKENIENVIKMDTTNKYAMFVNKNCEILFTNKRRISTTRLNESENTLSLCFSSFVIKVKDVNLIVIPVNLFNIDLCYKDIFKQFLNFVNNTWHEHNDIHAHLFLAGNFNAIPSEIIKNCDGVILKKGFTINKNEKVSLIKMKATDENNYHSYGLFIRNKKLGPIDIMQVLNFND